MNIARTLVPSIIAVFFGSVVFVNAVEYLGSSLKLSKSFVGSIVSPFFTSFPELIIFLLAVMYSNHGQGHEIALGVIFGEPFMASSIAYTLVLAAILLSRFGGGKPKSYLEVDRSLMYPFIFISLLYPVLILASYFSTPVNYLLGILFLASYVIYIYTMRKGKPDFGEDEAEAPYLSKFMKPMTASVIQILVSIALLYYGSELLIEAISGISVNLGIDPLTMSILVIPLVTTIPETITAMIWGYQGKGTLSIGALVGEKVLYSTLYPGIALLMIPWVINESAVISVVTAEVISLVYLLYIRRGRMPLYALSFGLVFFVLLAYLVL